MGKWVEGHDVWLYIESDVCTDIKVKENMPSVRLEYPGYSLYNTGRSFPNVTELIIGKDVASINIPNSLFPNVKKVTSESVCYASGSMLIAKGWMGKILINSFCKDEDFLIDMFGINRIEEFAFDGCKSTSIFNTGMINNVSKRAFKGSAFEKQPFVNGIKLAGTILIDMDDSADEIILPKVPTISTVATNTDFMLMPTDQTLIIENIDSSKRMIRMPRNVILRCKERCNPDKLLMTLGSVSGNAIENIVSEVPQYKTVDGIVYSSDMKTLIFCPRGKTGDIVIPEGVERIRKKACECSLIQSVKFPDSLRTIETNAFSRCNHLKTIDFGHGIKNIGGNGQKAAFSCCRNLESVELPEQIVLIGHEMFGGCENLKSVKLNEGLEEINSNAFYATYSLKEIRLPKSLKRLSYEAFSSLHGTELDRIFIEKIPSGFIPGIVSSSSNSDGYIDVNFNERHIFIPKSMRPSLISECKSRFNIGPEALDDKFLNMLYSYSNNSTCRILAAIASYEYSRDEQIKNDLASHYAMDVMLKQSEELFIKYLSFDFVYVNPDVLKKTEEKGWNIATAYILNKLKKQPKKYPSQNKLEL